MIRRKRLESQAQKMNQDRVEKLARGSWEVWRQRTRDRRVDEAKAGVARDFFLQRRVWNEWRAELGRRKLEGAEKEVGRKRLGRVFSCESLLLCFLFWERDADELF